MGIFFGFLMYMYYLCFQKKNKKEKEVIMKKVINIILLVVLGVSLSGCEWWDGPGFGVDGGSTKLDSCPVDTIMTEIAQAGCKGKIVDIISFCKANGEIDANIQTIQISDSVVSIEPMIKNGKYFEMNITINNSPGTIKYNVSEKEQDSNVSPAEGIRISCNRKAVISNVGVKEVENNHDTIVNSEFFLWDVFKDNTGTYIVLSASENTNIQYRAPKGKTPLDSPSVEKIINEETSEEYSEIFVMGGGMNGVGKTGYVIDNRVYLKNSLGNWNYYCDYYYSDPFGTSNCVTMIVMKVNINEESEELYFSTTNKENKFYFNQSLNKPANSRYYIASWN